MDLRYEYYEMKEEMTRPSQLIPKEMQRVRETLGWCAKAVDSLAGRLVFQGFKDDAFDMTEIYQMNNADTLFDSAVLSAMIASCCFIYIAEDEDGYPRLQVINANDATGIMDESTRLLTEGYAVLERDDMDRPKVEAYFEPGKTTYFWDGRDETVFENPAPYPLLVPVCYRPDAKRPFGHSRISRACMEIMQDALGLLQMARISAEFYSFPQKYVSGMAQDAEEMDNWRASVSSFLTFTVDGDGNSPKLGQFTQQSMSPYTEQLRTFAALFAGETGLTLDDLGFVTDNPSSAEAIKASHETLRAAARTAQRHLGVGFLNAGYLAACLRDNAAYRRREVCKTKAIWEPVFEPDATTLSAIGDGAIKINQAVPGYFGPDNIRALTGIEAES